MRNQEHRYQIYETQFGFTIVPREEDRPSVTCNLSREGFWGISDDGNYYIPLYCIYRILDVVVDRLYNSWRPDKVSNNFVKEGVIIQYCKTTTRKSIAKVIKNIWKNKIASLNPVVSDLHRLLYSVSNGSGYNWYLLKYILSDTKKNSNLIHDLLTYKAARIWFLHYLSAADYYDIKTGTYNITPNWREVYAYGEIPYTSLNKSLEHIPGGITFYKLFGLSRVKLPEPALTRIRLYAYAELGYSRNENKEEITGVIARSSDEDIKNAVIYIWKNFLPNIKIDFRKTKLVSRVFFIIYDYPYEIGKWDLLGLAKRSVKYHRDIETEDREKRTEELLKNGGISQKTALPPVALPVSSDIRFLDTVKEVLDEESLMHHCIGAYAQWAVSGLSYLFHINYNGDMASVEVDNEGFVRQAYGPYNTENKATEYGKTILNRWGRKIREKRNNKTQFLVDQTKVLANIQNENVYEEVPF